MSHEKRLILFTVVTFVSILAANEVMRLTGLIPEEKPPAAVAKAGAGKDQARDKEREKEKGKDAAQAAAPAVAAKDGARPKAAGPEKPKEPAVPLAEPSELILGSARKGNPYRLEVHLDQRGAGVASMSSSVYEAEFVGGKRPRGAFRPLEMLKYDPLAPTSLALTLVAPNAGVATEEAKAAAAAAAGEVPLDGVVWEVVRTGGKAVHPVTRGTGKSAVTGQEAVFRTTVDSLGLTLTKTYRLFPGADGFEMDLTLASPGKAQPVVYKILAPHGIPIEGEWYTGTFRDAVFGQLKGGGTEIATLTADAIAKRKDEPERFVQNPLKYVGVENQYFVSLMEPVPFPTGEADRRDAEARPVLLHVNPDERQKASVGVEVTSKPVPVGPNAPVTHSYRVFAGPKTERALTPFGAEDLAFRKTSWIPGAADLARWVISPLLGKTYQATEFVGRLLGGRRGNYGVAIILLTLIVRMVMFPLGRKQALAAKKMQDLQPLLKEIQVKYKDDKEAQTKETWALYKRHGVNPVGGCLPALVQLPIFVGLWQALNSSVNLRHADFLWIDNLAAPDMLFRFPVPIPFLGEYFNLLPFVVVALMLVQTKLFSPPATTPEAEAQQKMMKYMMVFMAFMFYKVPSGLGIYFITSSLWQIGERLLLPKVTTVPLAAAGGADDGKAPPPGGSGSGGGGGGRGGSGPAKPPGRFSQFWEKVLEEAKKDTTYRNITGDKDRDRGADRDRDRDGRDKGKPRARPGRRR